VKRYLQFFGALAVFLAIVFASAWVTLRWITSEKTVNVPDLYSRNVVAALKEVGQLGLDLRVTREEYHPSVARHGIIAQYPKAGTLLKVDRNIEVVISLGMRDIAVPDVRGLSIRKAELILNQNGLSVGQVTQAYVPGSEEKMVLAQNPLPLAERIQENVVNFLVSLGSRPPAYRMPDLIRMDFDAAMILLESAGLNVGNVHYEQYPGVAGNRVINQSPAEGYRVSRSLPVTLVVNREESFPSGAPLLRTRFHFRIPFGFRAVHTDVIVDDRQGRRRIFSERKRPGSRIELMLETQGEAVVEVYLNGRLVQSREYR
jgi:serine/threonine-protein kinase